MSSGDPKKKNTKGWVSNTQKSATKQSNNLIINVLSALETQNIQQTKLIYCQISRFSCLTRSCDPDELFFKVHHATFLQNFKHGDGADVTLNPNVHGFVVFFCYWSTKKTERARRPELFLEEFHGAPPWSVMSPLWIVTFLLKTRSVFLCESTDLYFWSRVLWKIECILR